MFSTELSAEEQGTHTIYNPKKSPNYVPIVGGTFNISYADDTSLEGKVANDSVTIAGITSNQQALELPYSFSSGIIDNPADGIVGLGFRTLNSICSSHGPDPGNKPHTCPQGSVPDPQPTWIENVNSGLTKGVFTVNFKAGTPGYFNFGDIDRTAARKEIVYTPVNASQGFWQLDSPRYRIGNKAAMQTAESAVSVADSGSSLLTLDDATVEAYYAAVPGSSQSSKGGYIFNCTVELPDLSLGWGDKQVDEQGNDLGNYIMATIPGKLLNYVNYSNDGNCKFLTPTNRFTDSMLTTSNSMLWRSPKET